MGARDRYDSIRLIAVCCMSLLLLFCWTRAVAQSNFAANEYNLLCQGRPSLSLTPGDAISEKQSMECFEQIMASGMQFNYVQGNCHNRAHLMSLILRSKGVKSGKIWAFAPGKYTLVDTTLIEIEDPNHIAPTDKIQWGYHVAPIYLVKKDGVLDTMVIDPSLFNDSPVRYKDWISALHTRNIMYMLIDSDWYLFNTLNGLQVWNNGTNDPSNCGGSESHIIPTWFPSLITGDFFKYEGASRQNHWLEKGMAINDIAWRFVVEEIEPIRRTNGTEYSTRLEDYRTLVGVVQNFELVFRDKQTSSDVDQAFLSRYAPVISKYRRLYEERLEFWINEVRQYL